MQITGDLIKAGWIETYKAIAESLDDGTGVAAASETTAGIVKKADYVAVPASFADLAAVRTYLLAVQASMIAAGQMSAS